MQDIINRYAEALGIRPENVPNKRVYGDTHDIKRLDRFIFTPAMIEVCDDDEPARSVDPLGNLVKDISNTHFFVDQNMIDFSPRLYHTAFLHELVHIRQLQAYADKHGNVADGARKMIHDYNVMPAVNDHDKGLVYSNAIEMEAIKVSLEYCEHLFEYYDEFLFGQEIRAYSELTSTAVGMKCGM